MQLHSRATTLSVQRSRRAIPGKGSAIQPYECAPGFTMANGTRSPESMSWDCRTLVLTCLPPPHGMIGGLKNTTVTQSDAGLDVMFKYTCS